MKVNQLLTEDTTLTGQITLPELKNVTGLVNVTGAVDLSETGIDKLPAKFGNITGSFSCSKNQLTSLKGAPSSVGGNFYCHKNQLTSLEGGPSSVGGNFYCNNNKLTSLIGVNKYINKIDGEFCCNKNPIKSGGLGLLLIKDLTEISWVYDIKGNFKNAVIIINKYLTNGSSHIKGMKALYICEDELIQAGLEEFAQI